MGDAEPATSTSGDGTVRVWDLATGRCVGDHEASSGAALDNYRRPGNDGIRNWEPGRNYLEVTVLVSPPMAVRYPGPFNFAAETGDGRTIVAGTAVGQLFVFRLHRSDG